MSPTSAVAPRPRVLSVVVPVFNERATAKESLDAIVAKTIPGWELEIIMVESNSTDGTRDIVLGYKDHPRVKVVLEDKPSGKGHAVREGFKHATGEVMLIQDADLEYDLADYDILLAPIAAGRQAFVLGSRHGDGGWALRKFDDQPLHALVLNLAHWSFTLMINVSLGLWLKDPFTMYKVFRRDCLDGLTFECNRFDFDWELLIKLVRKGHRPIEIPISYKSRSFKEGKKNHDVPRPAHVALGAREIPLRPTLTAMNVAAPSPTARPRTTPETWWAVIAAYLLLIAHKPWALTTPQLWAEDGPVHLLDNEMLGWRALLTPHRGYLHTLPRMIAWLASHTVDIVHWPGFYNGAALLVTLGLFVRLASPRLVLPGKPWARARVRARGAHRRGLPQHHQPPLAHGVFSSAANADRPPPPPGRSESPISRLSL